MVERRSIPLPVVNALSVCCIVLAVAGSAYAQPCGGTASPSYAGSSSTSCPGTTQTRDSTYSLNGTNACQVSGLNRTYSVPSGQTLNATSGRHLYTRKHRPVRL